MTLFGANVGGYVVSKDEKQKAAFDRILAGFGAINVVRWWPTGFPTWKQLPPYYGDRPVSVNCGNDVTGMLAGTYDDALATFCRDARRRTWLTFAHEPEDEVGNGTFTLPDWQRAQRRVNAIVREASNPLVTCGPLLMGVTYHPNRYKAAARGNVPASTWLNYPLDCAFIAADLYQWGKDDASADRASVLFDPLIAAARAKGKQVVVGELGARRVNPPYAPGISDGARARFLTDAVGISNARARIQAVMYYETDRGPADKAPWNLLPAADGSGVHSPKAAAVWRNASGG